MLKFGGVLVLRNLFFHILSNALKLGEKNDYSERHILREKSMQSSFFNAQASEGKESSITSSEVTSSKHHVDSL